ncbi:MAG: haloacid dehalogenase type II [Pseudomonadota bacterium]
MKAATVLAFDVFGTVVDWYSGIRDAVDALDCGLDGADIALAWRAGYQPAMQSVRGGDWVKLDVLHRRILDAVLAERRRDDIDDETRVELTLAWHRLPPWPDAVEGIHRLATRYTVCPLSNGNLALLTHMAKAAGLHWDCVLSAEVFRAYKPDPTTYLGVASVFDVEPSAVMMVACHPEDLDAASALGLQTAYVDRPDEFGTDRVLTRAARPAGTREAMSITALAAQLGC